MRRKLCSSHLACWRADVLTRTLTWLLTLCSRHSSYFFLCGSGKSARHGGGTNSVSIANRDSSLFSSLKTHHELLHSKERRNLPFSVNSADLVSFESMCLSSRVCVLNHCSSSCHQLFVQRRTHQNSKFSAFIFAHPKFTSPFLHVSCALSPPS